MMKIKKKPFLLNFSKKITFFPKKRVNFKAVWHRKRLVSFAMLLAGEPKWKKRL